MFKGIYTALITPFKNGEFDINSFEKFVEWQISKGVHGLVPCGTTGESPTLTHDEHKKVVEVCISVAKGRVPVMAGAGSNSTLEAVELANHAKKVGADAVLSVVPYYNKPTQEGMYQHFEQISKVGIPVFIYNIPARSVVNMTDETIARLAKLPNIAGIKDATGDLVRPISLRNALGDKQFYQMSGEDITAVAFNAHGGVGCISVTSNIAPEMCATMQNLWHAGKAKEAYELSQQLYSLSNSMFIETNPSPVKYAASLLGFGDGSVRLPLVEISDANKAIVKAQMTKLGLI